MFHVFLLDREILYIQYTHAKNNTISVESHPIDDDAILNISHNKIMNKYDIFNQIHLTKNVRYTHKIAHMIGIIEIYQS